MGTILIATGLGLVVACASLYHALAAYFFPRYVKVTTGIDQSYLLRKRPFEIPLQVTGVAASVLIIVGVALRFGVHSALVVVTVVLVGFLLHRVITRARDLLKGDRPAVAGVELPEPLRPDL